MSENAALEYKWRFRLVLVVLLALALIIVSRLVFLHLLDDGFLKGQGDARSLRVVEIPAHRGMILDRNGEPLAVSAPVQSIWVNPKEFVSDDQQMQRLAKRLGLSVRSVRSDIADNGDRQFLYLRRHMTPQDAKAVLDLELPGIYADKEYKRYYPSAEVATHVVGFTNVDGIGQEGLELAYDQWLDGESGSKRILQDRKGRSIKDIQALKTARAGHDLQLSIDLRLQYLAYRELKAAVQQHKAKSGSAVVLDIETGEVLAMVNQPSYNPNNRRFIRVGTLRNRATTDTFEPGSTVKPLTVAAAIASGRYRSDSEVDTNPGYLRVKNRTIRDHRNYGVLDLTHIITKSSNVGASKLALSIDEEAVRSMFFNSGLGQATGVGFPGERVGRLPHYAKTRVVERAALSYGYGLAVTPLQLAQAYLSIGSGGIRRPVSLIKVSEPPEGERIMPEHVARAVLDMMEQVTEKGGTGKRARVPAFRVAGKTGTVHKVGSNGYEDDQYVAMFAGIAPVAEPRFATVVIIDEPQGEEYYGGEVAAPVFSRIMAGTLRLMNIAPDQLPAPLEQQLAWN